MPSYHLMYSSTIVLVIVSAIWIVSFFPTKLSGFNFHLCRPGAQVYAWKEKVLSKYFFWTVMLEKMLESTVDCKKIKPVNPKGNQPWTFTGRTDGEASILWPPDVKSQLIRKDLDDRKDWGKKEKGTTKDKIVGWHHRLNRHWANSRRWWRTEKPGCCGPWGRKESDTTERLNNNNKIFLGLNQNGLNWIDLHCTALRLRDLTVSLLSPCCGGSWGVCPRTMKDDDKLTSLWFIQRSCLNEIMH